MSEYMFEYFSIPFLSCKTLKSLIGMWKKLNSQTLKEIFKMTKCIYITQESEGGGHVLRKMKSTTYPGSYIGISQPLYYFKFFLTIPLIYSHVELCIVIFCIIQMKFRKPFHILHNSLTIISVDSKSKLHLI